MLVDAIFEYIRPALTLKSVFLAAGAPHFDLALHAAGYVERVYAVDAPDVSAGRKVIPLISRERLPPNLVRVQAADVPAGSVHVAFSGDLETLPAIHRTLAPGGLCFCVARGREAGSRVPPAFLSFLDGYRVVAIK